MLFLPGDRFTEPHLQSRALPSFSGLPPRLLPDVRLVPDELLSALALSPARKHAMGDCELQLSHLWLQRLCPCSPSHPSSFSLWGVQRDSGKAGESRRGFLGNLFTIISLLSCRYQVKCDGEGGYWCPFHSCAKESRWNLNLAGAVTQDGFQRTFSRMASPSLLPLPPSREGLFWVCSSLPSTTSPYLTNSFVHSFIPQKSAEHLPCPRPLNTKVNETDMLPALKVLIV